MSKVSWSVVVDQSVAIIRDFIARGVTPTVRTVYYALFSRQIIPNTMSAYKRLSSVLVDARKEGKISWHWIADETRETRGGDNTLWEPDEYAKAYVDYVIDAYKRFKLPKWLNQHYYIEIWIEKFALADTFNTWLRDYNVILVPSRGYSSWTFLKKAVDRIESNAEDKEVVVLYFGDWDPSGVDIERFLAETLQWFGIDAEVKRIAVDPQQIQKYSLPPVPAKSSDARYGSFVARFGEDAVELDALLAFVPDEFERIVRESVEEYFDSDIYDEVLEDEKEAKQKVKDNIVKMLKERLEEKEGKTEDSNHSE